MPSRKSPHPVRRPRASPLARRRTNAKYYGQYPYGYEKSTKDIVTLALANPKLSELVKLVKKADLVKALQAAGPFTVFAPSNAAFAKLFAQAKKSPELAAKLKNPAFIKRVLQYHVLPQKVAASQIGASAVPLTPKTLEGKSICVYKDNGGVKVNNAKVIKADLYASNGVIHVIDTVLVPNGACNLYIKKK